MNDETNEAFEQIENNRYEDVLPVTFKRKVIVAIFYKKQVKIIEKI